MGNIPSTIDANHNRSGSVANQSRSRSRRHHPLQPPQSQIAGSNDVSADSNAVTPSSPCGPLSPTSAPSVEHQKAVTIRNSVNIKKETLRIEPDQHNPGTFLLAFTFDATTPGSITVMFFAKETIDGNLIAVKESMLKQISMPFEQGLCQRFIQPSGTGIDFSMLEQTGLTKEGDTEVYPLVLKAEALPSNPHETDGSPSFQITLASFVNKEKDDYKVQVMKQILWIKGKRYELQEIYGIENANDGNASDETESGRECVVCLSAPREITVLPCRHMCMCSGCTKLLTSPNCPICRHPVERLLEIMVDNGSGTLDIELPPQLSPTCCPFLTTFFAARPPLTLML
ncbi:putative E3 ubiquitin-protein ligase LUL2 [Senna tora]|uniref:RING-type E3 ubiquitin transferase n=1 Tax=Senna tora TaxID=362788 RepID=A0A834W1D5_9FABA|nr:putative E3 ubiquitin-protein ligase LUL2 [Senna tora]